MVNSAFFVLPRPLSAGDSFLLLMQTVRCKYGKHTILTAFSLNIFLGILENASNMIDGKMAIWTKFIETGRIFILAHFYCHSRIELGIILNVESSTLHC